MAQDLTAEAHQGFDAAEGADAPFLATSPSWLAWKLRAIPCQPCHPPTDDGGDQPRRYAPGR
jgi:hypothetical protein